MITLGFCLILLGAAIALAGCLMHKPDARQRLPVVEERRAVIPSTFADRNARGQMSIPDTAPDGTATRFKWTAIESAGGQVFYGKRYQHKPADTPKP